MLNLSPEYDTLQNRALLRFLDTVFIQKNPEKALLYLHEDFSWEIVGHIKLTGIQEVMDFLETKRKGIIQHVLLDYVLLDGKNGSIGGKIILDNSIIHFTDFYEFTSNDLAKIKMAKSFAIVETKE